MVINYIMIFYIDISLFADGEIYLRLAESNLISYVARRRFFLDMVLALCNNCPEKFMQGNTISGAFVKGNSRTGVRISDAPGVVRRFLLDGAGVTFPETYCILPGLTDVHVHLREPGFSYKETIATGTLAAAAGGFVSVMSMPNLDPVPDCLENLKAQLELIDRDARVEVRPLASLTKGEKGREASDIEGLAPFVPGFSDDGVGVMDDGLMRELMERVKAAGSIVVAHCEDERYPRESREAEYRMLERDLKLASLTGCPYHACHLSTAESIELIRGAKSDGLDVTCETAPHYLTLSEEDIRDEGRFKMNPPIKKKEDRDSLIEALTDGTVDMIATDHAPHSHSEKKGKFADSAYGIVGLETAFSVLYTKLVREGMIPFERLVELFTDGPNGRFFRAGELRGEDGEGGNEALRFTVWDLDSSYPVDPGSFLSKGKSSPFSGWEVFGKCMMTVIDGRVVYRR